MSYGRKDGWDYYAEAREREICAASTARAERERKILLHPIQRTTPKNQEGEENAATSEKMTEENVTLLGSLRILLSKFIRFNNS